ncbi:C13 family peptidase [Noviherbaspirillum sp.]|uniref:C13 family peptidase n=1 Tax=Noviherbaspirillum sp. TaxID=1926288 RepID=UPI002D57C841|nr:C13 family peptidase [Noviherbaspirillum sp.]HZW20574.1 C13 family peptidase [Noviherbaspirillum sp.]
MNEYRDASAAPGGSLAHWMREGARAAFFLRPRWKGLLPTPAMVALLVLCGILLNMAFERLYVTGAAVFDWRAVASGWLPTLAAIWVCYMMRGPQRGTASLVCMVLAQSVCISLLTGAVYALMIHAQLFNARALGTAGMWGLLLAPGAWNILAQLALLWREGNRRPLPLAALSLAAAVALHYAAQPPSFWLPGDDELQDQRRQLSLTQELMEAQPQLLAQRLKEIRKQRPGTIDVYAITFAPYSDEDVFRRESAMVAEVMAQRFGAEGKNLQLVNHVQTLQQWPWATPRNLQRAIQRVAELMDRNEDILFLHLTSHGARDGQLAAEFWPMTVAPVRPADLKAWLDEAGIRYRVISISACYSGSWIPVLAGDGTLVMTAADAEHTSYGCGRGSELTFFGRAMFHEQLRSRTHSFEAAHAAARDIIRQREEEAGKDDGYSNPQISAGPAIKPRLARLEEQLKAQLPR